VARGGALAADQAVTPSCETGIVPHLVGLEDLSLADLLDRLCLATNRMNTVRDEPHERNLIWRREYLPLHYEVCRRIARTSDRLERRSRAYS
jgi:hypothetical protein